MADTVRTLASALALIADNLSRNISPQDLRDVVVSTYGVYGEIYIANGSTAQGSIGTTYTVITGFNSDGTNGLASTVIADKANNRIRIPLDGVYKISAHFSFSGTNSRNFTIGLHEDGVLDPQGIATRLMNGTGDLGNMSFTCIIEISGASAGTPVELDLRIKADTGASNSVTIEDASFDVVKIG